MTVSAAVAVAHRSGSPYVAAASRILAFIFIGSIVLWLTGRGVWRYALLELFALGYFFLRWSARRAQHKQFHFLMLGCYVMTTAFYTYQLALQPIMPDAVAMSGWHYQLLHNVIFAAQLALVIVYGVLYRRAHADRVKYFADVDGWFEKAGAAKRGFVGFVRRTFLNEGKR